ncbi:hypothetical protein MnTg02_01977 [bacterium MnTg02]|nr:hypothetical protein MnTg02_01977 [bacterium MnTg02]
MIAVREIGFFHRAGPTGTFGDILTRHFDMNTTRMRSFGAMHVEKALDLAQNAIERPGLVARRCLDRIAMHRIARPDNALAFPLDSLDEPRQMLFDMLRAKPANQRQSAWFIFGIEDIYKLHQFIRIQGRTAFHANRIVDAARIFHMGVIRLPGPVADPQEMTGCRVPIARR